jgi:hypothetical protein
MQTNLARLEPKCRIDGGDELQALGFNLMIEPILVSAKDAAVMTVGRVDLPSPDNTDLSLSRVHDPEAGSFRHHKG